MTRILAAAVVACVVLCGCTANQRARSLGGSETTALPRGMKLVVVTWKESNLWYLTRPMRADEQPETYTFSESSSWGMLNGNVTLTESK